MRFLCEHPQWAPLLRAEVIAAIDKHGWTKSALYEMRQIDSFLNESQRLSMGYRESSCSINNKLQTYT